MKTKNTFYIYKKKYLGVASIQCIHFSAKRNCNSEECVTDRFSIEKFKNIRYGDKGCLLCEK